MRNVVYCLTRGYSPAKKLNYLLLVVRNLSVIFFLFRTRQLKSTKLMVLHEGNVSKHDQAVLNFLALGRLTFQSVAEDFKRLPHQIWPSDNSNLGYSLMCRFQYSKVWKYLVNFDKAIRVDEDIVLLNGPSFSGVRLLTAGLQIGESHKETNESLPIELEARGLGGFYDHEFPYTNVMALSLEFWLGEQVQEKLNSLGDNELALIKRWGDLPVLGVVAKKMGGLSSDEMLEKKFTYLHLSHLALVRGGKLKNLTLFQAVVNLTTKFKSLLRVGPQ